MKRVAAMMMVAAVLLSTASLVRAGAVPLGPELQANSYTTGQQFAPAVSVDAAGRFVVVWNSFDQDGSETGVFGQRFDSDGMALGAEFQVNTYTTNYQIYPSIAMNASGEFRVAWSSEYQLSFSDQDSVFGQRYDSGGNPQGGEFQVNTYTFAHQYRPDVTTRDDGSFIVAWSSFSEQDGHRIGIFAQRFDSDGSPEGGEFQVNTYTTEDQNRPSVASNATGDFVVVWEGDDQDGDVSGIFGQLFASDGSPLGAEFQVNTFTTGSQSDPAVAMAATGEFVVVWTSYGQDDLYGGIFGQLFDSSGLPAGSELEISTRTGTTQRRPDIAMLDSGEFAAVWEEAIGPVVSNLNIAARAFQPDGFAPSPEFMVNTYTPGNQFLSSVAMDATGRFTVAWTGEMDQDGSSQGIFARTFTFTSPHLTSPAGGDTLDCTDPGLIQPTFTWIAGNYDRFKVFMGSDPGFVKGTRVTSGKRWIQDEFWTPPRKKWKRACQKALEADPFSPLLYVQVLGKDRDLSKQDPERLGTSLAVLVDVMP